MQSTRRGCLKAITRGFIIAAFTTVTLVLYYTSAPAGHLDLQQPSALCDHSLPTTRRQNHLNSSQNKNSQTEECSPKVDIMFMKTHKTASSTLLNILFRFGEKHNLKFAFPDGRNDFHYPSPFLCSQVKNYQRGVCFNIVCNHMRFDGAEVAKLLPSHSTYITILRDPADLFESSFHYFHRTVPFTWGIPGSDKLAEFLSNPRAYFTPHGYNSFYLRNLLFFDFGFDNNLEGNDPGVERAILSLSKRFDLVLIAEHFEESLILLKDSLCWSMEDLLFFRLNTRRGSSVSRLGPALRDKARRWNGADWELYQYFNTTFWEKVEAYGRRRMEQDVEELKRRNEEMAAVCIEGGGAVEAGMIQDEGMRPWQPLGERSILGYNLRTDIDPKYRTHCRKMLTPEIQYLSNLGVNLWITQLWGWLKDILY